jgi:putative membrane protein
MPKLTRSQISVGVMIILHTVGVIGLSLPSEWQQWFIPLTPVNLLLSGYFVLRHAEAPKWGLYALIAFLAYSVEALGIHTGWPFGEYWYGSPLGPHVFEVPILIGLLWLLLLAGSAYWAKKITKRKGWQVVIVAAMMVGLDFLIEPVAVALEFWTWSDVDIPWNNYLGWFGTALILAALLQMDPKFGNNRVAGLFFWIQTAFFLALNLLLV